MIIFRNYIQGVMQPVVGKVLAGVAYALVVMVLNLVCIHALILSPFVS